MANNTTQPASFDIGGLPTELQLEILGYSVPHEYCVVATRACLTEEFKGKHNFSFCSSQFAAFALCKATRPAYLEDFKFTNFRAFITAVDRADKLQEFRIHLGCNNPHPHRQLDVSHITTNKLPDTFDNALKFIKFLMSLMKKLPGPPADDVRVAHQVRECGNEAKLLQLLYTLGASGTVGRLPERLFAAFRQHHIISSWEATNAGHAEEMRLKQVDEDVAKGPLIDGHGEDEDNVANRVPAAEGLEQAVGGAEISEDYEDMETDQESDEVNIKEEEEDEPPGVLYDHDQHQMSYTYPPPADFSAFLGQAFLGYAYVPVFPHYTAEY
ncbi:hypothetical protein M409DRAFT_28532 [Zasmidium cellare ATCC 36951]|uniref:Uncharacterized protein n=1 Tax=Zasmidium cellare ATCC 36951 TaxID=1080233 RepID=A0A6A6C1J2_ZASCE|nr:uncharacterized protein M409DRAFT_28532 [Zasmidium cellare ATCC 36951]KAF2160924.1 hypothetical protein M409DRAFT_28532 [Zasmidium cellare ATCC 36951]